MILVVALCGGLGALTRFLVDSAVAARNRRPYPVGTLIINVTGSFLLGLLTGFATGDCATGHLRAALGTGFLGGYTTFSTALVECVRLGRGRRPRLTVGLALGMCVLSVAAAAAGLWLGARA